MYKIFHQLIYFALIAGLVSCNGNAKNKITTAPAVPVTVTNANLTSAIFYNSYPANV